MDDSEQKNVSKNSRQKYVVVSQIRDSLMTHINISQTIECSAQNFHISNIALCFDQTNRN